MKLSDLIQRKSEWLKGEGPKSNIVMSTRIRIARNLDGHMFFNWANDKERKEILEKSIRALRKCDFLKNALFLKMSEISQLERELLIERHLMSMEHAVDVKHKALVIEEREVLSIMLNEEDHLRLQVLQSGFNIMEGWRIVDEIDTGMGEHLTFAYSSKFGYLTSCPTNTGTGLRASVMLHLPALQMTDQVPNVYEAISKLGLTIRGFYGEGTEASGNFFQISNQVALGYSEMDILDNLERVINKIIAREEDTRDYLVKNKKQETADNIFRSYGTLKSARIITSRETIILLSAIRLGVDLGLIKDLDTAAINELLLLMQPAHIQRMNNSELTPNERDMRRADLVRERLGGE